MSANKTESAHQHGACWVEIIQHPLPGHYMGDFALGVAA